MAVTVRQAQAITVIAEHLLAAPGDPNAPTRDQAVYALALLVPAGHKVLGTGVRPSQVQAWLSARERRLAELVPMCAAAVTS